MCIFVSLAKIYDRIFLHCIIFSLIHRMKFTIAFPSYNPLIVGVYDNALHQYIYCCRGCFYD
jgi:hypothetical protein